MADPKNAVLISEDRALTPEEIDLLRWLLEHKQTGTEDYLSQVGRLRVTSRCGCGCASVDFSFDGKDQEKGIGLEVLSNWYWGMEGKDLSGVFAFAKDGRIAGIEVWSVDGSSTPTALPKLEDLREFTRTLTTSERDGDVKTGAPQIKEDDLESSTREHQTILYERRRTDPKIYHHST
jgi:hypothetical protein